MSMYFRVAFLFIFLNFLVVVPSMVHAVSASNPLVPVPVANVFGRSLPIRGDEIPQFVTSATTTSDKLISISLKDQDLKYYQGTVLVGEFKISSGLRGTPTPPGEYEVLIKKPVVDYEGVNYSFPHTKWNLEFKKGKTLNYYIHGAYWHHNFGHPMSHGCINVSYANMEPLYNWADVGTKIIIQ